YKIIMYHGVIGHCDLVAGANDEVLPRGELKPAQNKLRGEQNLVQACMGSVWPKFIIDFNCRPKIFKQVILESRVPQNRVTEIPNDGTRLWSSSAIGRRTKKGVDRDLHADRRLNIEITPAFAPRQGGLRNQDIVRDAGPVTAWNGHLEEAG